MSVMSKAYSNGYSVCDYDNGRILPSGAVGHDKYLYLDFEQPIAAREGKIEELRHLGGGDAKGVHIAEKVDHLKAKVEKQLHALYS